MGETMANYPYSLIPPRIMEFFGKIQTIGRPEMEADEDHSIRRNQDWQL
jgi:hypothetical protein